MHTEMLLIVGFVAGSMAYAYKFRGQARFENLSEYLRNGWPIFTPFNCMLYMFTEKRARKPIMDLSQFKELDEIKNNWETICEEALNLSKQRHFDTTNKPGTAAYFDIGFRTFFKSGWSKFYLKWYGYTHQSAQNLCPKTVEILSRVPSVNGAMFSLLPGGSQLTRHLDPVACSLRYHLGLNTPNADACFISIDGTTYSWRDGNALLFDETYLHFAKNDTNQDRLILMCDVERPMNFLGKFVNFLYKKLASLTVVPNLEGDKRGLANTIFGSLSPILAKTKALKQTNRGLYLLLKYSVNITLLVLVTAGLYGAIRLVQHIAAIAAQ